MEELEKAAELLLEDYDTLKKSDGYLYDLADVLKQVLSNSSQKYHREMVSAYRSADIAKFNEASDQFLSLIDKVEEVLGTRKEFLFGTWTRTECEIAGNYLGFLSAGREWRTERLLQPSVGRSYTGLLQTALDDVDQSEKGRNERRKHTEHQLVCF